MRLAVHSTRCICLILAACVLIPGEVTPQQAPSPSSVLDRAVEIRAERASLTDILRDIATRYNVRILADGLPVRETADCQIRGSLRESLDKIADVFDYTWRVSTNGVILLDKRFKNPNERPQLNLLELRHATKDMLTVLPQVEGAPSHDRWGEMIVTLADMLSPEQVQILKGGGKLPASNLTPAQRSLLEKIVLTRGYGVPRGVWERLYFQLDNMKTSEVQLIDPSSNAAVAAPMRKLYYVMHEARNKVGRSLETRLGQFEKQMKP